VHAAVRNAQTILFG